MQIVCTWRIGASCANFP